MVLIPVLLLLLQSPSAKPNVHMCTFRAAAGSWRGSCGRLGRETPALTLAPKEKITTGRWQKNSEPSAVWAGKITYSNDTDGIEVEIYQGGKGILRSPDGWFLILRSTISDQAMEFEVDFATEAPPSELDHEIVRRAAAILSSQAVWNRTDTRNCHPADTSWSIYCAMEKATIEVTGGFHHRRPALQLVRQIVDQRSAGRPYKHRLMDYNNDPTTGFPDVQSLFAEALRRMGAIASTNSSTPTRSCRVVSK